MSSKQHDGGARPTASVVLSRNDVAQGLGDLVAALHGGPRPVRLRLIGGAAIALVYDVDRASTVDIDAHFTPRQVVIDAARSVGERRGWSDDWLNDAAAQFLPAGFGAREQEWVTVHDDGTVVVQVGSAEMLLAMKVFAAQQRGMREHRDIGVLAAAAGIRSADEAEALFEEFYPGDALSARTMAIIKSALDSELPGRTARFPALG